MARAEVNYEQIIERKLNPEELTCSEKINVLMQILSFLLNAVASETDIKSRELEYHNEIEFSNKLAIINCNKDYKIFDQHSNFEQAMIGQAQLIDGY